MLDILLIIAPVFLVVGAGYIAARAGVFAVSSAEVLMKTSQTFAIPCLLFLGVARLDLGEHLEPGLFVSFYTGAITCFVLGIIGARLIFKRRPGESVSVGFAALFSNSLLLGIPITTLAYGEDALSGNFAIIAIHSPLLYTLGITAMEFARSDGKSIGATLRQVLHEMSRNTLMIGVGLGMFVNLTNLPLPTPVWEAVELLGRAGLPMALFAIGGILTKYGLRAELGEAVMIAALSLVLHPSIAYALSHLVFDLPLDLQRSAVLTAAMAPGINAYIFASLYDRAKGTIASAVLLATALSVISVTVWIGILD